MTAEPIADDRAASESDQSVRAAVRRLRANPDFRRLWVAESISQAGSSVSGLTLPLLVLAVTGSAFSAGLVATVGFVSGLVGQVPAGHLGDVANRKRLLVGADLARAALLAGVAVIALTGWYDTTVVLGITAASTIAASLCGPAGVQALRTLVNRSELAEANALRKGRGYALELVTPSAGGALFALNRSLPFVADTLSFLASSYLIARIRAPLGPDRSEPAPRFALSFATGWTVLWRTRFLRWSALFSAASNLVVTTLVYIVLFGGGTSGAAVAGLGATVTAAAAAGLLGSSVAPFIQRRMRLHHVLAASCAFRALAVAPALLIDHQAVRAGALVAVVFSSPIAGAASSTARMLHVPADVLGRVTGAVRLVATCAQPLAPLIGGLLIEWAGPGAAAGCVAAAFAAMAVSVALAPSMRLSTHA